MSIRWLTVLLLLFITNVSTSYSASQTDDVTASLNSSELVVTNNTSREVYYAVYETDKLKLIEWVPVCTDQNLIFPKRNVRIPVTPSFFHPSGKAILFWWHKGTSGGPDKVKSLEVNIK